MRTKLHERIHVVYEDPDVIVIDKASGVITYPTGEKDEGSAIQLIRLYWKSRNVKNQFLYLIHRLDMETSGLLVFAKTTVAREELRKQFESHEVVREYVAVTEGIPSRRQGKLKTSLGRDSRGRRAVTSGGRLAITAYAVIREAQSTNRALVRCKLFTGRTHQIRIHLAYLEAPVVGDRIYGRRMEDSPGKSGRRKHQRRNPAGAAPRLALHAESLGFIHPRKRVPILFRSPLPSELRSLLHDKPRRSATF